MDNKDKETWVTLKQGGDIYSRYLISDTGKVWDNKNDVIVKQQLRGNPEYFYVNLNKDNGERVGRRVHNIMGWSFLGEPPSPKHTVDHIDRNKYNNLLSNLRWSTRKEQSLNRDVTIICEDGKLLADKIKTYCKESGETYKDVYSTMSNLYTKYKDFNKVIKYRQAFMKYGTSWSCTIKVNSGKRYLLLELCEQFNLDFYKTKELLKNGVTFEDMIKGFKHRTPKRVFGIEYNNMWYPNKEQLIKDKGNCTVVTFNDRVKSGMTIEEALTYKRDGLWLDGLYMTQKEHCDRLNISYERIMSYVHKHNIVFKHAVRIPIQTVIKHNINGITKRNSEWCKDFNIKPKTFNSWLNKSQYKGKRNFRQALEYFGVNTSDMTIYPCDGEIVMYHNPL